MSVFLLALVGPAALETSLLSLGFVDFFLFYYPTLYTSSSYFLSLSLFFFFFAALIWLILT